MECDFASPTPLLEQYLMGWLTKMIQDRRQLLDISIYPAAARGYTFKQGNSAIAIETRMGIPQKLCLTFSNTENSDMQRSPSNFSTSRITELAHDIRQEQPNLVTLRGLLKETAAETATRQTPLARTAKIIAFPTSGKQPAFA
jgi:hypothetical protein